MSRRAQENVLVCVFLAIFVGVILLSLDFGPRARMIPLPLAVIGVSLALIQLVWQNVGSTDALRMDMIQVEKPHVPESEAPADAGRAQAPEPSMARRAGAYGIVAALVIMILAAGPMPAVFVFTLGYFLVTRYYTPLMALLFTGALTAVMYLLFFVVLQINPYYGLLAPLVARFE
jgi:hypothetical protein